MIEHETARLFLNRLIELTEQEQQVEEQENALLWSSCPFSLLEAKGVGLGGLQISRTSIGLGGRTLVTLVRSLAHASSEIFPSHGFRSGDSVSIKDAATAANKSRGSANAKGKHKLEQDDAQDIEGVVWKVTDKQIVIALGQRQGNGSDSDAVNLPQNIRLLQLSNPATYKRQLQALRNLLQQLDGSSSLPHLASVLLNLAQPTSLAVNKDFTFIDETLNHSQREAVEFCLSSQVGLVWGPPGKGKTQTLVEIIRQLVRRGQRVLVCGGSNLSVDNVLQRLSVPHSNLEQPIPLTRIGHPARVLASLSRQTLDSQTASSDTSELVSDIKVELEELEGQLRTGKIRGSKRREAWDQVRHLRKDYINRERGVVKEILDRARVVLGTTHGVGGRILNGQEFDVIVIDEAAQAAEPACWIPVAQLPKAKQLILAGDHLQLPPTVKSLDRASVDRQMQKMSLGDGSTQGQLLLSDTLETTLFSRLLQMLGPGIRRMLSTSYRFNASICAFPSAQLYNNQLVSAPHVATIKLSDLDGVIDPDEDLDEPIIFIDTAGQAMYERAGEDGARLSESKSNENEATICTKYINNLIEAHAISPEDITVISPYNAQVALLSSLLREHGVEVGSIDGEQGRENEVVIISLVRSNEQHQVGFLAEQRRLNVAMTRAKRQLVVIGDSETVSKGSPYLKAWMEWLEQHALVRVAEI